jgi:hypothetical protein
MWWREYKDYRPDSQIIKETVEPGRGIIGCEMHDRQGWGLTLHQAQKPRRGSISRFFAALFGVRLDHEDEER